MTVGQPFFKDNFISAEHLNALCFLLLPVSQQTYPQGRKVRTQRKERDRGKPGAHLMGALSPLHVNADKLNVHLHQNAEKGNLPLFSCPESRREALPEQKSGCQRPFLAHVNLNKGEAAL